jgi:hypothetical protein
MRGRESFDLWVYEQGYQILLTDVCIDQIIAEEGGSHQDGSTHEYEPAKCTLCGDEKR